MKLLFDTNLLIYHFNGQLTEAGTALLRRGMLEKGAYSVITRIEVLGYQQSELAESQAQQLLHKLVELPLTSEVAKRTIAIRKGVRIKGINARRELE
jgi:predicted nucleic acid-binding protein